MDKVPRFGIFFDWSGVISDDTKPVYLANNLVLSSYGKPVLAYEDWKNLLSANAIQFARGQGIEDLDENIQARFKNFFLDLVKQGTEPVVYEHSKRTVEQLASLGFTLAVISSHPQESLQKEAEKYGLADYFVRIIGSIFDKSVTIKELCKELDLDPQRTIYIGDAISDVRAAKRAGVRSVAVYTGKTCFAHFF